MVFCGRGALPQPSAAQLHSRRHNRLGKGPVAVFTRSFGPERWFFCTHMRASPTTAKPQTLDLRDLRNVYSRDLGLQDAWVRNGGVSCHFRFIWNRALRTPKTDPSFSVRPHGRAGPCTRVASSLVVLQTSHRRCIWGVRSGASNSLGFRVCGVQTSMRG